MRPNGTLSSRRRCMSLEIVESHFYETPFLKSHKAPTTTTTTRRGEMLWGVQMLLAECVFGRLALWVFERCFRWLTFSTYPRALLTGFCHRRWFGCQTADTEKLAPLLLNWKVISLEIDPNTGSTETKKKSENGALHRRGGGGIVRMLPAMGPMMILVIMLRSSKIMLHSSKIALRWWDAWSCHGVYIHYQQDTLCLL